MLAPRECLDALRCTACGKYLSVPPIHLTNDGTSYCGRCAEFFPSDFLSFRNIAYESLLKFIRFPCIYENEGCLENLTPSETIAHEAICPRRTISCPTDCMWQGTCNELLQHFEDTHPTLILRNGEFEMDLLNSYEIFNVLVFGDEVFGVKRAYNSEVKLLNCQVSCFGVIDVNINFFYEMKIENGTRTLSVKFPAKPTKNKENITEITITSLLEKLKDPNIMVGSIKILNEQSATDPDPDSSSQRKNPCINYDMLSELECPVCMDFIIPPIYQCSTGHSICCYCKEKVSQCPTCKSAMGSTQNFSLEKMAYFLTYPCKYSVYGCDITDKPLTIKEHQKYCTHGPRKCPLKDYENCQYEDAVKKLYSHIISKHHDNVLEIELVNVFVSDDYYTKEDSFCYVLNYDSHVFLLHYQYKESEFSFAMQLLDSPELCKGYKFEIDVIDNTGKNQRLLLRSICCPETDKENCFVDPSKHVFLHLDQLKPFINEQFTYRVRILKQ